MPARNRPQSDVVRRVGRVLRAEREAVGARQGDMAARCGMSASAWCHLESCRQKDIGISLFIRLATALGMTGSQLLALVERPVPSRLLRPESPVKLTARVRSPDG